MNETNKDTIRITIANMDDGNFRIAFKNRWFESGYASDSCKSMATAAQMDSCLWYWTAWFCGGNTVNATFYDADGIEVSSPVIGGTGIYDMESGNLMNGQCTTGMIFIPETTASAVTL